jgi:hypothetical protein
MKFLPIYSLSVETNPKADGGAQNAVISPPISVYFDITRQSLATSNYATFKLVNLAEATRNAIFKDKFDITTFRSVQFRAGYGNFMPLVFNGTVLQAYSYRQGVDFITEIQGQDGAFAMTNGFFSQTIQSGASAASILNLLSTNLPQISGTPIIGDFPTVNTRAEVLSGNTWGLIYEKSGGLAYIDNNQVKALNTDEVIPGEIPLITGSTGLLGSPRRGNIQIEAELLFEPRLTVGQIVQLKSTTNSLFNGTYKVTGFKHSGLISPTVEAPRTTTCTLFKGTNFVSLMNASIVQ